MMRKNMYNIVLSVLFTLLWFIPNQDAFCGPGDLYAGTAKVDITPPSEMKLKVTGHGVELPFQGVHDPMYIKVLVLELNSSRIAFITCDIMGYYIKGNLDNIMKQLNIDHLMISGSHTHTAVGLGRPESPYARYVETAMARGLEEAVGNMFPAEIMGGYRRTAPLGYNRLILQEDGYARASFGGMDDQKPGGPSDPEVGVIKIDDQNGNTRVVLMMYACHPVTNNIKYFISADYPGVATKMVEEELGKNSVCMFVQGGAGNINPISMGLKKTDPSVEPLAPADYVPMEKMGTSLAKEVLEVVKSLKPETNVKSTLKIMSDSLKFTGRFDKTRSFNIHFTTLLINDDIAICSFPGEPFIQHQFFWKENARVPHPFFFGYTFNTKGESPGYVADIHSAARGGYGADNREGMIQVGAGESIMLKHLENLYRLRGIMRNKPGPQ